MFFFCFFLGGGWGHLRLYLVLSFSAIWYCHYYHDVASIDLTLNAHRTSLRTTTKICQSITLRRELERTSTIKWTTMQCTKKETAKTHHKAQCNVPQRTMQICTITHNANMYHNIQKGLAFCMLRGRVSKVPSEHIVWPLYCRRFWPFTCIFFMCFVVFLRRKAGFWYADWLLVYLVSFTIFSVPLLHLETMLTTTVV